MMHKEKIGVKRDHHLGKILKVRGSRKGYIPIYLMILTLVIAITVAKIYGKDVNTLSIKLALIFSALGLIFTEVHRYTNFYEINSNSLIFSTGLLKSSTRRIDLLSISDADSNQTLWQRMLNYGDVNVRLFSKESSACISGINDPMKFVNFLIELIDEKRESGKEDVN